MVYSLLYKSFIGNIFSWTCITRHVWPPCTNAVVPWAHWVEILDTSRTLIQWPDTQLTFHKYRLNPGRFDRASQMDTRQWLQSKKWLDWNKLISIPHKFVGFPSITNLVCRNIWPFIWNDLTSRASYFCMVCSLENPVPDHFLTSSRVPAKANKRFILNRKWRGPSKLSKGWG